jgi:hypothetical protein
MVRVEIPLEWQSMFRLEAAGAALATIACLRLEVLWDSEGIPDISWTP